MKGYTTVTNVTAGLVPPLAQNANDGSEKKSERVHRYPFITDKRGVTLNIIKGEFLTNNHRLFEVLDVEWYGLKKVSYMVCELQFPAGWRRMIDNSSEKFQEMKQAYPVKQLILDADTVHMQVEMGKLYYWWPGQEY